MPTSGPEVARAYATIIPSFEGAEQKIADGLTDIMGGSAVANAGKAGGAAMGESLIGSMKGALGPAAVAAAVAGVSKTLFDIGKDFDSYYDTIAVGTGATGEALDGLEDSFRRVAGKVPTDMGKVASALADLNTRTGATDDVLEQLTLTFVNLSELGMDADINAATGAMNAWDVSTEDMSGKMDELFIVSQSTGVSIDKLTGLMGKNAGSMKTLGFSFEQTAALAGNLDKAGLDASSMMSKMSTACVKLAKDGEEPRDAYKRLIEEMRGFIDAGNDSDAMRKATDIFGTKGAPQFIQALETGAFDIDELTAALDNSNGAINDNVKQTRSFSESVDILTNKAKLLLEPLGSRVFSTLSGVLDGIVDITDELSPSVQAVFSAFGSLTNALGLNSDTFSALAGVITGGAKWALDGIADTISWLTGIVDGAYSSVQWFFGLFDGSTTLSFPHISLPHIWVSGGELPWGIGGMGTPPSVGVDWYAKGGIADGAQIVGVGENGPEAIMPLLGREMEPFAKAVAMNMEGMVEQRIVINNLTVNAADVLTERKFESMLRGAAMAY